MLTISLGLGNAALYGGYQVEEVGGRLTLTTPVAEAVTIVGRNAQRLADEVAGQDRVVLTGPMAVWAYLVVFHTIVHRVGEVWYDDGRGNKVLIAKH